MTNREERITAIAKTMVDVPVNAFDTEHPLYLTAGWKKIRSRATKKATALYMLERAGEKKAEAEARVELVERQERIRSKKDQLWLEYRNKKADMVRELFKHYKTLADLIEE